MNAFVQAKNYTHGRRGALISLLVIHTMESPEGVKTALNVAKWFAGDKAPQASAHYCLAPNTRILHADLRWRPIGDVKEDEELAATEELSPAQGKGRTLQTARVTRVAERKAPCRRVIMADGREVVCSTDHRWLGRRTDRHWHWLDASWLEAGAVLSVPFSPWAHRDDRTAGYIEGLLDGEGCWTTAREVSFAQKEGPVLQHAISLLIEAGIPFRQHHRTESGVTVVTLSGLVATLRALGEFGSRRLSAERRWVGRSLHSRSHDNYMTVAAVEDVGMQDVVSIETSTRTFFAEGIVSHNCVDRDDIIQCVGESDMAWAAPGANANGLHIELAGRAGQTAAQWDDEYSRALLERAATLAADLCRRYQIPIKRLGPGEVRAGARGICGHVDVTKAFPEKKGTHWDPGPHFPWDRFIQLVMAADGMGGVKPDATA